MSRLHAGLPSRKLKLNSGRERGGQLSGGVGCDVFSALRSGGVSRLTDGRHGWFLGLGQAGSGCPGGAQEGVGVPREGGDAVRTWSSVNVMSVNDCLVYGEGVDEVGVRGCSMWEGVLLGVGAE